LIRRWLPRDADVVELGASIGIVSREILNRIDEQHGLFAVEAVEGLAQLAEANLARLHVSSRWRVLTAAVAYNVSEVFFNADQEHVAGRIVGKTAQGDPRVRRVPARTLSSIIDQFDLSDYSLVMDIEGAEHELIAHEKETLSKCRCVIAELHGNPGDRDVFCQTLEAIGMRLVERKHSVAAFIRQ
jgi:FkbM family methyltransferase